MKAKGSTFRNRNFSGLSWLKEEINWSSLLVRSELVQFQCKDCSWDIEMAEAEGGNPEPEARTQPRKLFSISIVYSWNIG